MKMDKPQNKTPVDGSEMKKTDLIAGSLLSLFALFSLFWIIPNFTSPAESELDLAPGFMPSVAMWTSFVMAFMLIAKRLGQNNRSVSEVRDQEFGDEASGIGLNEVMNLGQWCLLSFVTVILLMYISFEIAGFLMLSVLMVYARLRNYIILFSISVFLPIFLSILIGFVFEIELP